MGRDSSSGEAGKKQKVNGELGVPFIFAWVVWKFGLTMAQEKVPTLGLSSTAYGMWSLKQEAHRAHFNAHEVGFCGWLSSLVLVLRHSERKWEGHHDCEWEMWIIDWRGSRHDKALLVFWEVWTCWDSATWIRKQNLSLPIFFKCGPTATPFPAAWVDKGWTLYNHGM